MATGIKKWYRHSHRATDPTTKPEFESEMFCNRLNKSRRKRLNENAKAETRRERHLAKRNYGIDWIEENE